MLFAIHAYEGAYYGLHGIEDRAVVECIDEDEAIEIALDMAAEVIEDYCFDDFEDEDEEDFYESHTKEWNIYKIKETTKSLKELDEMFCNDPDSFIENFCEKEI